MNEMYEVRVKDGKQFLYYNGEKLPLQVKTKVEQNEDDAHDNIALVSVTVYATLIDTI